MKRLSEFESVIEQEGNMHVPATIFSPESMVVEEGAINQLKDGASLPSVVRALATPDIHLGFGVPIGSVFGFASIVCPAAVGYDINCGMRLHTTMIPAVDFEVENIANSIRRDIPLGEGKGNISLSAHDLDLVLELGVEGLVHYVSKSPGVSHRVWDLFNIGEEEKFVPRVEDNGCLLGSPGAISEKAKRRGIGQLGTLGGGNHFIEIQVIEEVFQEKIAEEWNLRKGDITVMIHSGSRGLGHEVGGDAMQEAFAIAKSQPVPYPMPNDGLAYFNTHEYSHGAKFMAGMSAAANYAFVNRLLMSVFVRHTIKHIHGDVKVPLLYDVSHNIAKVEEHEGQKLIVHRKGATRAFGPTRMKGTQFEKTGQPVLIPGSMGTSSYILAGVDANEQSLCSVNHGAGRAMGRNEAAGKRNRKTGEIKREGRITDEMFKKSMEGIILLCENTNDIKAEAPQAYKDIDEVINCVIGAGLALPVAKLRPLAVLKG